MISQDKMSNARLIEEIERLKEERNAIILSHNYQPAEIQEIADYLGDSLGLSRKASKTDADVIVFCGVQFMAETAAILSPDKTVLLPDINAGCPMADMLTAEKLRDLKRKHPDAVTVAYVNTSAEVKAEVDICCTSSNAIRVIESLRDASEIIFVPDKYLADYVSKRTDRNLIVWDGFCPSHVKILPEDVLRQKRLHPKAEVMVHPECIPEVIELADEVLSTEGMCRYTKESSASELIVGTETGILHRLRKENPGRRFYPASESAVCPAMKIITLKKILWSLREMRHEIRVPEDIRVRAERAVNRMLNLK
ncbi:MAG TPA: quinolinate synthase NadA [Candidatus Altiarchaeales archaeon]|nr:quinolinate synthase NadA [Candidatus Altiarchaeales archaeon]